MTRILQLCIICLALAGTSAPAQAQGFPPGFIESQVTDPTSGLPVQLIVSRKAGAPWLVLIHGLGQQASNDWLPVVPALAERYQLLLFDLPGFGRSGRPDVALTPQKYAQLVHWLVSQHAREPVFVVGHSLGGAIALRYTHDYPDEVKRLLLIDAAGILQTAVFARHLSRVPGQVSDFAAINSVAEKGARIVNHFSGKLQDMVADNATTIQALAGSDAARAYLYKDNGNMNAALGLVNENFAPLIRRIQTPVWMLWQEQDPVAPVRIGLALQWLLPHAQLDTLPGAGHVPMSEAPTKTSEWLLQSLQAPRPAPKKAPAVMTQGDGHCKNKNDMLFQGTWDSLNLEHCANVRIENATIGKLVVTRSSVTLVNVNILAQDVALESRNSNIVATGILIKAPQAWSIQSSRIDLAAANIMTKRLGQQSGRSHYFLSVSRWCDGAAAWQLHDVLKPRNGELDQQFRMGPEGDCTNGD